MSVDVGTSTVVDELRVWSSMDRVVGAEIRVRWHSLRIRGIEDAGSSAGTQNAWMAVKMLEAYGS